MHECPNCGQACDCIGDDTWDDMESDECTCDCEWAKYNGMIEDDGFAEGFEDHEG